jgi:DNA-binding response OmpR family regulator
MDRILIIDRDPDHAEALMASLCRAGRSIETCSDERIAFAIPNANQIDVLIVVPPGRSSWKEQVREIRTALKTRFNRPAVLCVLRWAPQGPADRLFGDSLGVEVQHEY